ncbi:hypothetical protein [Limnothrix redekei]|uniref:Uncharacterized protein n=1 Tax=Limnothrix redekei LRLZ20PSL1 TaxID=3112953 RepID=A0ABW7C9X9_9CYAN
MAATTIEFGDRVRPFHRGDRAASGRGRAAVSHCQNEAPCQNGKVLEDALGCQGRLLDRGAGGTNDS